MNKSELIKVIAKDLDMTQGVVKKVIDSMFRNISEVLSNGGEVEMYNFGLFRTLVATARIMQNIKTGVKYEVSERKRVTFRASQKLKDLCNNI